MWLWWRCGDCYWVGGTSSFLNRRNKDWKKIAGQTIIFHQPGPETKGFPLLGAQVVWRRYDITSSETTHHWIIGGWSLDPKKKGPGICSVCFSSWWLNQPIWKICSSIWIIAPGIRDENKECLKPPPSSVFLSHKNYPSLKLTASLHLKIGQNCPQKRKNDDSLPTTDFHV